jgi:hypothetical protein
MFTSAISAAAPRLASEALAGATTAHPAFGFAASLLGGPDTVALNPQPLPPKEGGGSALQGTSQFFDDWCGTVPKRFPPPPPPSWLDSIGPVDNQQALQVSLGVQVGRQF